MQDSSTSQQIPDWSALAFDAFSQYQVRQVAYVPDAGHSALIRMCSESPAIMTVPLTTEEEGIALLTGGWLGGDRGALLMQSSGVGNCINMLSVNKVCAVPTLMLVTMRGEEGETNPWQVPMGQAMRDLLAATGVAQFRISETGHTAEVLGEAMELAFNDHRMVAVCIAQSLIGVKQFVGK